MNHRQFNLPSYFFIGVRKRAKELKLLSKSIIVSIGTRTQVTFLPRRGEKDSKVSIHCRFILEHINSIF